MTSDQLDDLFRAGSNRGEFAPRPGEWEEMSALLDAAEASAGPRARRAGIAWLTVFALLIAGGLAGAWYFTDLPPGVDPTRLTALPLAGASGGAALADANPEAAAAPASGYDVESDPRLPQVADCNVGTASTPPSRSPAAWGASAKPPAEEAAAEGRPVGESVTPHAEAWTAAPEPISRAGSIATTAESPLPPESAAKTTVAAEPHPDRRTAETGPYADLASATSGPGAEAVPSSPAPASLDARPLASVTSEFAGDADTATPPPPRTLATPSHVTWGLSVREGLSSVGKAREVRSGTLVGVDALVRMSPQLRLRTGLAFGSRRYGAPWDEFRDRDGMFHGQATPKSLNGTARLLELPLALELHPRGVNRSGWFATGGIALRYVLNELIEFTYHEHDPGNLHEMTSPDVRRLDLGSGELAGGYRFVADRVAWRLGPTLEIPLSGIGYGDVDVYTLGLRLGVEMR